MLINEFSKPVTVKSINENLAKKYGKTINVDKFTTEQLEDARNRLRTTLSQVETNESFDAVHTSETYQKNKMFLELLNTAISERQEIEEAQSPAQKAAFAKMLAKKSGKKSTGKDTKDKKPKDGKMPMDDNGTPGDKSDDKPAFLKKKKVKEGAEEQATLVMAAKDMVDRITGWMEDTAEMQTESMLELGDKIRDELGVDQSETFINTVKPALGSLFTSLESTRDSLTSGVAILTGEGAPSTMGDEVPADDMDMEPTVDADAEADAPEGDDEFAAADASVGGDEPDDRGKRESIELSKRLGLLLADSKKKD
jgi:hypothetical protein|tara:strand:- start:1934 stop:2866 length:933 start_codon:yes stop_codon:yes gene_type:complete